MKEEMVVMVLGTRCTRSLVEVEQPMEEVTRGDSKPALDVCKEGDGLAGPLGREHLTSRQSPAHLLPGLQQTACRQALDLLLHHGQRLPNALRWWCKIRSHLFFFYAGGFSSKYHKRLRAHAMARDAAGLSVAAPLTLRGMLQRW
jgi:hypothetical protein